MTRLPRGQAGRRTRPIANKIRGEIFFHFGGDRSRPVVDAIDDRIGQPRQRHARGIDVLALRIPFRSDRLRERRRGRREHAAGRRAHRLVVEPHGKTVTRTHRRGFVVETLAQRRPNGAARSLHGVFG